MHPRALDCKVHAQMNTHCDAEAALDVIQSVRCLFTTILSSVRLGHFSGDTRCAANEATAPSQTYNFFIQLIQMMAFHFGLTIFAKTTLFHADALTNHPVASHVAPECTNLYAKSTKTSL